MDARGTTDSSSSPSTPSLLAGPDHVANACTPTVRLCGGLLCCWDGRAALFVGRRERLAICAAVRPAA
jgi:hypothetical protein